MQVSVRGQRRSQKVGHRPRGVARAPAPAAELGRVAPRQHEPAAEVGRVLRVGLSSVRKTPVSARARRGCCQSPTPSRSPRQSCPVVQRPGQRVRAGCWWMGCGRMGCGRMGCGKMGCGWIGCEWGAACRVEGLGGLSQASRYGRVCRDAAERLQCMPRSSYAPRMLTSGHCSCAGGHHARGIPTLAASIPTQRTKHPITGTGHPISSQ